MAVKCLNLCIFLFQIFVLFLLQFFFTSAVVRMGMLFCSCLHVANTSTGFWQQKLLTELCREQSKRIFSQVVKLQADILQKVLASEACRCEIYRVSFTWQAEQDRDTLLSSSVRISCFRTFSWFPPPLIPPSSSLPPPFTRWLLMSSKVWSWT